MKKVKKLRPQQPTLSDVVDAVQGLSGKFNNLSETVQDLTEAVQGSFARVETDLDRHERILKALVVGQDNLLESVNTLSQRVTKTQTRIEDVVDEHEGILLDHGRRLKTLEKGRV